jgi:hypothetical protein
VYTRIACNNIFFGGIMMKTKRKWIIGLCVPICLAFLTLTGCEDFGESKENAATPVIKTQPAGASYELNAASVTPLAVSATVGDGGVLSYLWYKNTADAAAGWEAIADATASTFTPPVTAMGTTYYRVRVTNTNNEATGDKVVSVDSATARITVSPLPVVSFAVNTAGTAFESTNTDYTATNQGGAFEAVNGLKVFNTGGTADGTKSEIPWWAGNHWDNYQGIGYVDLGTNLGDLLISLPSFSIETYVCLPANAQTDRVGQYVWAFTDHVSPENQVSFNIREFTFRIKQGGADNDEDVNVGWDDADSVRANGTWHHIVVVKDAADNTGTIYWDGSVKKSGASTKAMSGFAQGTFTHNTLGGEVYPNGVYDQQLFNTKFHSFSIYESALSAAEVTALKDTGGLNTLNGN